MKNGTILGFAGILMNPDIVEVMNIVVRKSCRHQGIGEKLLKELIRLAGETNLEILSLEVNCNNIPAISLYQKLGFQKIRNKKKILQQYR
ncbi:MAG: GNAT family N-acetyltransferase [Clostridia bacterium]|nr:GNAT family N-acetyltransferase [Clostridia bacterium]